MMKRVIEFLEFVEFRLRGGRDLESVLGTFTRTVERLRSLRDSHNDRAADLHDKADELLDEAHSARRQAVGLQAEGEKALSIASKIESLLKP